MLTSLRQNSGPGQIETAAAERGNGSFAATISAAVQRLVAPRRPAPSPGLIEFYCSPKDKGVVAEPMPAKAALPEWFRRIPAIDKTALSPTNSGMTIKRCMPFLDALSAGWILPLAATVRLEVKDQGRTVNAGWDLDRVMVSNHGAFQVAGNPRDGRPPCKFHNFWTIRTPPGWSCLFVPPLNRPNPVFECLAGIVDTDNYPSLIHFPFFATGEDGIHVIERGTPLVQVVPFRRSEAALEGLVRVETKQDGAMRERILHNTQAADGWYRKESRASR